MLKAIILTVLLFVNLSGQDLYKLYEKLLPFQAIDRGAERKEDLNSALNERFVLRVSGTAEYFPMIDIFYRLGI